MNLDLALWYVVLVFAILMTSFFSSSETALSSANLIRLRQYVEEGKKGAKAAYELTLRFEEVLLVILVSNNVAGFSAAGIATIVAMETFGETGAIIATILITVVITLFGEIVPKSYGRENPEAFLLKISGFFLFLLFVMKPVTFILSGVNGVFSRKSDGEEEVPSVTEDELNVIIDTMEEEGVLEEEEVEMLQGVLDLSEMSVKSIMIPRVDVTSINVCAPVSEVKEVFLSEKFSRIPVFEQSHDNVIGVLYERDLFEAIIRSKDEAEIDVTALIKAPVYVSDTMKVSSLLAKLRFEKQHMAIVIDEYGASAGVVTMEDVLEEVVGEIYDEHDEEEQLIMKKGNNIYEVRADIAMDELLDHIDVKLNENEDDMGTVGSWLYSKLEDIPNIGDEHTQGQLKFTITSVEEKRIKHVKIEIMEEITAEN